MPLYDYECPQCGEVHEHYVRMAAASFPQPCPKCKAPSRRILTRTFYAQSDLDYVEENLGTRPIRITSRKQREQLMKEAGVSENYGKGWV